MIARAVVATVALVAAITGATAEITRFAVSDPRDLGYFIGDTITREIEVSVDARFTLAQGSLPAPGPLTYWLELNDVAIDEDGGNLRSYRIALAYQTFYAPLEPRRMVIPGFTLRFVDGDETITQPVPQFSFLTSPLREIIPPEQAQDNEKRTLLAPDPGVRIPSTQRLQAALGLATAAALLSLAAIAWRRAWWPFHHRPARPFSRAARTIRATDSDADRYRRDLIRLHRAFDESAGRRVLAEDAPIFIARRPEFANERDQIAGFFAASRRAFFAGDTERAMAEVSPGALADLVSRLGVAERSAS